MVIGWDTEFLFVFIEFLFPCSARAGVKVVRGRNTPDIPSSLSFLDFVIFSFQEPQNPPNIPKTERLWVFLSVSVAL